MLFDVEGIDVVAILEIKVLIETYDNIHLDSKSELGERERSNDANYYDIVAEMIGWIKMAGIEYSKQKGESKVGRA